jgi:GAF domain-containing protein/anti-sigma regulatory factor (Ser/Thr protein kinase)
MRRGESKAKGRGLGRRTRSAGAKGKTRARSAHVSATALAEKLAAKTHELDEALGQQAATSEILEMISSSPGDLDSVFEIILKNGIRLCDAKFGNLWLYDGSAFRVVAIHGAPPAYTEKLRNGPAPGPETAVGRLARTMQPVQIADIAASKGYLDGDPVIVASVELAGTRTLLAVPMLKDNQLVGAIAIYRQEVKPFAANQVELVSNFAKQAVIAIENTRLLNELRESLQQQIATADVLKVISSSPGELEPVFNAMLENATRICEAKFGTLFNYDGRLFHPVAVRNAPPTLLEFYQQRGSFQPPPGTTLDRLLKTRDVVNLVDDSVGQVPSSAARLGGAKSQLAVPMFKDEALVGAIVIYRQEVRPFTEKQIELVSNFAKQAVIAIENVRLLNELRESLQQQTATADVLKVISRSAFDLQAVLNTLVESAARLCEADKAAISRPQGDVFEHLTSWGYSPEHSEYMKTHPIPSGRGSVSGRTVYEGKVVHIADVNADSEYTLADGEKFNVRTMLGVPLAREGTVIGVIVLQRGAVRPFTDKQIELVSTFADQAVIAIENTRLFDEVRARTKELTESLEQQTATSEVLQIISSSQGELEPVFQAMLENATRLCEATFGSMLFYDGDAFRRVAMHNAPSPFAKFNETAPLIRIEGNPTLTRLVETRRPVHVTDLSADSPDEPIAKYAGARTLLVVPMLKENELIGAIGIYRKEVRLFTEKQIELVQNFAKQALIAIENARLLNELRQRTGDLARSVDELRALGDVSQAVNSTLDLATVLSTIVTRAVQLSGTDAGTIYEFDKQNELRLRSNYGMSEELINDLRNQHLGLNEPIIEEAVSSLEPAQTEDILTVPLTPARDILLRAGYRAVLIVPLLGRDHVIGVLAVRRKAPGAFPQNTVDLLKTFAAQSVLAIQNAHLFTELDEKSRQLEIASQHKSQFLANMSHELRTPLNAILGYTELILDNIYGETSDKMREVLERLQANGKHLLGLINDVLDLSKIEAGQLTLDLADYSLTDVVHTVVTAVESLAAGKKLSLTTVAALNLPIGHGDERRLAQVLLNLVGNAIKFTDKGEVAIEATTSDGSFTVAVRDTGPGIAPSDQGKIFEEFQQADNSATKRKGGTGLGLSIAKRIIAMHGGRIWVESDVGKGSTFAFTIPVKVERQVGEL